MFSLKIFDHIRAKSAALVVAVALAGSMSHAAEAQVPGALRLRGLNLMAQKWYASSELPPTATPEQVEASGTQTTPTVTIRTKPGQSGTLFTIIDLADAPAMGGEVTIGDIDGDDETFFNGVAIGATSGAGISDFGNPRLYSVDQKQIKPGRNVLAVRITGIGGRGSFGIRREPLTFGFVPTPAAVNAVTANPGHGIPAIAEDTARAAIATWDESSSGSGMIQRKRPGFGRFGELFTDGLAAVSEISPTQVVSRDGPQIDVALDSVSKVSIAADEADPGVSCWHKLSRVEGKCSGADVRYTLRQHVFYPGAVVTLEKGRSLVLRLKFPENKGTMQLLPEEDLERVAPGATKAGLTVWVMYEPLPGVAPAILAVAGGAANATQGDNQIDVSLSSASEGKTPTKAYLFYPAGLRQCDLSKQTNSFADVARAVEPGMDPDETLRRWLRLGLNEPVATDEYFQVRTPLNQVRIYQISQYKSPPGFDAGEPFLCPPPQLAFAQERLKYPVELPPTTATGTLAFSGPLAAVDFTSGPLVEKVAAEPAAGKDGSRLRVFSYDLPIPPMQERGYLALPGHEDLRKLLNANLNDLATTTTDSGINVFYKSRTQGYQAFSYLNGENRKRLAENSAKIVPAGLRDCPFYETVEPFSGLSFWWTYFIEGPYFDRYDQDWGNGLSLYGLYYYVKYSGDWELVARNWEQIEKMFAWFPVSDDWEWMRGSNGIHGHGTGAGDCMSATYAAMLAYAKLARDSGRTEEFNYGTYMAARAALFTLNRFVYDDFATRNHFKEENSTVIGFHEGRGFLVGELNRYPWNVTSAISGNGVQPENFALYMKYAPDALKDYEKMFESAYPQWMDGSYKYPRATIYRDHSGYITLPHIYLRARMRMDGAEALNDYLQQAQKNTHLWWLAPPVVAEVMNLPTQAHVSDWGRCAFLGADLGRGADKKLQIELKVDNKYPPDMVEIVLPRKPASTSINDGPLPLTDIQFEAQTLRVKVRRPGLNKITIVF
ncbi:MAG: hypothetical protein K1X53_03520 [Candidatus Sumerlaeaceae bacterium]|nr:hypothetical protein [Candidatus Sumerlaeaceae bacterium]